MIARIRHLRSCFASEQGSLLVEVMVGALVLGITTTAVLSGLDGAQKTGMKNKNRSEYAALAQQDIERLRAKPITALSNYNETRTVRLANVDYTVVSETEWVSDSTGAVSCVDNTAQADYIKVKSTVTSPAGVDKPVTETTILTPAPGAFSATAGTAAVLLTDRDGSPLSGVSVSLSGPGSFSDTTNSLGCAIFGYIPSGSYTAQVSGGVTWASQLPATAAATVNPGRTTLTQIEVEQPASLRAHFKTPAGVATQWPRLTVGHAKLPAGRKIFPSATATAFQSSIDATNLFPHHDAYGVYAGSCVRNDPAFWDSDYYQPTGPGYIELDPGDNLRDVNVEMPTLTLVFTKRTTAPSFLVRIRSLDTPTCPSTDVWLDTTASGGATLSKTFQLPFGRYKLCVDDGSNRHRVSTAYTPLDGSDPSTDTLSHHRLTPEPGVPLQQIDTVNLTTPGYSSGNCPSNF